MPMDNNPNHLQEDASVHVNFMGREAQRRLTQALDEYRKERMQEGKATETIACREVEVF